MKILWYITALVLSVVLVYILSGSSNNDRLQRQKEFNDHYNIHALDLPENMTFAGEKIPVDQDDVRERFDRELLVNTYWQSQTLLLLKRKERWFGTIEAILRENGIPDDFKYVAMAESGLINQVSPSGATGFWQFLEPTALQYGLEISAEIDERYHVEKSTRAACAYLIQAHSIFKNWSLVAASYNMGIEGLRTLLLQQKVTNYHDLLLSDETSRYLFRIVALKEICSNPARYGFHLRQRDFYQPFQFYHTDVDSTITSLVDFAFQHHINYKELKLLNPWLRTGNLPNPGRKNYRILILRKKEGSERNFSFDSSLFHIQPTKEFHQE